MAFVNYPLQFFKKKPVFLAANTQGQTFKKYTV